MGGRAVTTVCKMAECAGKVRARGLCGKHYQRARLAGMGTIPPKPVKERFLEKTATVGDCWEWTSTLNSSGYGRFFANGTMRLAHRFAYELWVGPIPEGLQIDHLCR